MTGHHFVEDGKVYLVRCYACGRENYAPAVASGCCAFCGAAAPPEGTAEAQKVRCARTTDGTPCRRLATGAFGFQPLCTKHLREVSRWLRPPGK